jgi:exodeoxyribonuclease V alpha subunit
MELRLISEDSRDRPSEELEGWLEKIKYANEENGFTVAILTPDGKIYGGVPVTVVGSMLDPREGEKVHLTGTWGFHPRFGKQFQFSEYRIIPPASKKGIQRFLGSGLVKGVGPATAAQIVDEFGLKTIEILDNDPEKLLELKGIGKKKFAMITQSWQERRDIKNVMIFLQENGISTGYAFKIYRTYGESAIEIVRENPYRLCEDIWGIGFLTADRIARGMGIPSDSPMRIQAGILHALSQAADQGHVYLPYENLVKICVQQLEVDEELVNDSLENLRRAEKVYVDEGRIYDQMFYHVETGIAFLAQRLLSASTTFQQPREVDKWIAEIEGKRHIVFNEKQRDAIRCALSSKLMILTGGPGTGKTTTALGIIDLLSRDGRKIELAAPTGRAAQRLSETTGRPAKTIHRLLKFNPVTQHFEHGPQYPLDADVILVDEASMIDIFLMYALLKAIEQKSLLILVGDIDQLPSVGPGNVLKDVLNSGVGEVIRLSEIFRQARESKIVVNAHRINQGAFPLIDNAKGSDFFYIHEEDPSRIPDIIVTLCTSRLPSFYKFDPVDDIQVLSPMYKGDVGANNLNRLLQNSLNPQGRMFKIKSREFREGDKVMQVKNNYRKQVFNGDIGRIFSIDSTGRSLVISYGMLQVEYDYEEIDEIVLAYAVSVHKSQGSEYRAVILPVTSQHYIMLQRNLLYTAVTRAKELVVLVGTKQAIGIAIRNNRVDVRYTALRERLLIGDTPAPSLPDADKEFLA